MFQFTSKSICVAVLGIILSLQAFAQTGAIRGKVIDNANGEELLGAAILIVENSKGTVTDLDGKFSFENLPVGTYTLQVSYVSYQSQKINGVEVKAGENTTLNIRLVSDAIDLQEVVIEAKQLKNNESSLLTMQKNANTVMDGISAETFSKTGDADAGAAMRRVTGISVEGGKYVYVRGLGDRYSKTALNSAEVPGLDPNKNTVQMDLFPSNLIDNIVVYKTFSPELPGSFAGGFVNITTKDFPDQYTLNASGSLGYNTNATLNSNAISQDLGGNAHVLALSPSSRQMPSSANNLPAFGTVFGNPQAAQRLDAASRDLNANSAAPTTYTPFLNHSLAFSIGNQKEIKGKKLGYIAGVSYQRNHEYYNNGKVGRYMLPGNSDAATSLTPLYLFNDEKGTQSTLLGALLNVSLKMNNNNKISLNLTRNQSADAVTRSQEGTFPFNSGADNTRRISARSMQFVQRNLSSAQLKGEHKLSEKGTKLDWMTAFTYSQQDEPDLRFFNNLREFQPDGSVVYDVISNNVKRPARYFRDMAETNSDTKVNFELPIGKEGGISSKFKTGAAFIRKDRTFNENAFEFVVPDASQVVFNGDVDRFNNTYTGLLNGSQFNFGQYARAVAGTGSYTANEMIPATYAMIDAQIDKTLKISTGVRYEGTFIDLDMQATAGSSRTEQARLRRHDLLPAMNLILNVDEKSNVRVSYGRTIARPTFRELARFATFDFLGDFILLGNPNLDRTVIDNFDVRYEWFPGIGEVLSVSAFYKDFTNPIERAVNPNTNDLAIEFNYRNVEKARVLGGELEFRKKLDFITPELRDFSIGSNLTLLYSQVNIAEGELKLIRTNVPDAKDTRPMFGQAPYIVNAFFSYSSEELGLAVNVNYNVLGPRLYAVSVGGTPNIYERPRNMLDFNISQKFDERYKIKISANNILNAPFRFTQEFKGTKYDYESYRLGATYSVSFSYTLSK